MYIIYNPIHWMGDFSYWMFVLTDLKTDVSFQCFWVMVVSCIVRNGTNACVSQDSHRGICLSRPMPLCPELNTDK